MALDLIYAARLPVELYEEIFALAAWSACETDKPWLCALATTSRRVLAIVRPILYNTVCITKTAHVAAILASAPHGHFALTRCLWTDILPDAWHDRRLAAVFPNVAHFSATFLFLYSATPVHVFRPARFTLRHKLWKDADWRKLAATPPTLSAALRGITHLRLALDPYYGLPAADSANALSLHPALPLQYIVLESCTPGWNPPRLRSVILPFFLSGPHVRRLLVCATTHPGYMADAYALLEMYAAEHRERRLWVLDAPTRGDELWCYRPGVTFCGDQWTAGRPVYTETDSDCQL